MLALWGPQVEKAPRLGSVGPNQLHLRIKTTQFLSLAVQLSLGGSDGKQESPATKETPKRLRSVSTGSGVSAPGELRGG